MFTDFINRISDGFKQLASAPIFVWYVCNIFYGLARVFPTQRALDVVPSKEPQIPTPVDVISTYSDKYKDKLKTINMRTRKYDDVIHEKEWEYLSNSQLIENTPFGNVLIYYSSHTDAFVYYSDRVLPYGCIDTVGRRYAITYRCIPLYIDGESAPDTQMVEDRVENTTPNVFVKFKSYNLKSKKTEATPTNNVKINRYTYGGKLANFMFLKTPKPVNKLTYADFKRKQANNKSNNP